MQHPALPLGFSKLVYSPWALAEDDYISCQLYMMVISIFGTFDTLLSMNILFLLYGYIQVWSLLRMKRYFVSWEKIATCCMRACDIINSGIFRVSLFWYIPSYLGLYNLWFENSIFRVSLFCSWFALCYVRLILVFLHTCNMSKHCWETGWSILVAW